MLLYSGPTALATIFYAAVFFLTDCGGIDNPKTSSVSVDVTNKKELTDQQDTSYYGPLVDTILHHSNREFKQTKKDNITFYYESDTFFDDNINRLAQEAII